MMTKQTEALRNQYVDFLNASTEFTKEEKIEALRLYDRAEQAPAVPEGYAIVPTWPTQAMVDAWDAAPRTDDDSEFGVAYQLMIAAAGQPQQVQPIEALHDPLERAARDLPEGYDLIIEIERGAGVARVKNVNYDDIEMMPYEEGPFSTYLHYAIDCAISDAQENGND